MDQIIVGKLLITCVLLFVQFFLYKKRVLINLLGEKNPFLFFSISFLLTRILPFIGLYLVLGFEPQSDVPIFFESAKGALSGGFVYKDFQTVYSPLFPYLTAILVPIWNSAKAVVLLMLLLEGLFVWLFYHFSDSQIKYYKALFYLLLPSSLMFSVVGGQEDVLMWGFLSIALVIHKKFQNRIVLGVLAGLSLLLTKFIFILIIPAIVFYYKKWQQQFEVVVGLLLVGVPSFLFLYTTSHWGFLGPLSEANVPRTPNIWSFLHTVSNGLTPYGPKYLNWFGLATIEFFCFYLVLKYREKLSFQVYLQGIFILVYVWLMLIQQSSYAIYSFAYLLPLVYLVNWEKKNEFTLFVLLNGVLAIHPAIWWRTGLVYINQWSDLGNALPLTLFTLECVLLLGMWWFMKKVFQTMDISSMIFPS